MFRARKYIWQFSVYSWNNGKNHSAEKCGGGLEEKHMWNVDADKLQ